MKALQLFYLSDPQDGVSTDVKIWWVSDAQQDLQTQKRDSILLQPTLFCKNNQSVLLKM